MGMKSANVRQTDDGGFVVELSDGGPAKLIYCQTVQMVAHQFRLFFGDGVEAIGVVPSPPTPEDVT